MLLTSKSKLVLIFKYFSERTLYKYTRLNKSRVSYSHLARPKTASVTPKRLRNLCFSSDSNVNKPVRRNYISLKPAQKSESKPEILKSRNIGMNQMNQIFHNTEVKKEKNLLSK